LDLKIRDAGYDELPACAVLFERVVAGWSSWAPAEDLTAASMLKSMQGERVFVAETGGRIAGFLSFYPPGNFVHSLFVEQQRRGIGRALLAHAAKAATGPLVLKCSQPNTEGLAYYRHLGWEETGRGETNGEGWVMFKAPP
jgi:GNAT superfamily N-acetyltransferase